MTSPSEMMTAELTALLSTTDSHLRTLDRRMKTIPADTTAYVAMTEGQRDLRKFRRTLDDALASRGA
jgi:hypothetical protein